MAFRLYRTDSDRKWDDYDDDENDKDDLDYVHENHNDLRDKSRLQYVELRRLLYCMKQHENIVDECHQQDCQQSYHSLLFRAQLCQELWSQVASSQDWICNMQEYQELSQQVDVVCRRARELATQEQQKQAHQDDEDYDLIERLFFTSSKQQQEEAINDENDHDENGDDEDEMVDDLAAVLEEDEDEDIKHGHSRHNRTTTSSLQEIQQNQREQMEEAISLMAKQMKEATRGIQTQIQKQTAGTLNRLETVAEQNVVEVTQVTNDVQQHNIASRKSTWTTWTLLFMLVGVFMFTLMTIFTIPKSPKACLMCIVQKDSLTRRLLTKTKSGWIIASNQIKDKTMIGWTIVSRKINDTVTDFQNRKNVYFDSDSDNSNDESKTQQWKSIYDEDEQQKQEKERLDVLLKSMKNMENLEKVDKDESIDVDKQDANTGSDDNPWGIKAADDKNSKINANNMKRKETAVDDHDNPWRRESEDDKYIKQNDDSKQNQNEPDNPWGLVSEDDKSDTKKVNNKPDPDNPWGLESEDDKVVLQQAEEESHDNPWGIKSVDGQATAVENDSIVHHASNDLRAETVEDTEKPKIIPPEEVNMDDIIASLKQKEDEIAAEKAAAKAAMNNPPIAAVGGGGFNPTNAFERDGVASERFSPRDFRVKAATNDYETLQRYLSISTEFIDRQDKNGWSALHLATRTGHVRIVRLLLAYGSDPNQASSSNQTPLDLAKERFDDNHPILQAYMESINGEISTKEMTDEQGEVKAEQESEANEMQPEQQKPEERREDKAEKVDDRSELEPEQVVRDPLLDVEESPEQTAARQRLEEDVRLREKRRKVFQPISDDDEDIDLEMARNRLDALLGKKEPRDEL